VLSLVGKLRFFSAQGSVRLFLAAVRCHWSLAVLAGVGSGCVPTKISVS
jgi:hypothetical protein